MRALVIGADGFVGRWLIRHLNESGDSVDAVVGPRFEPPLSGVERAEQIDVRNADALVAFVAGLKPDAIYYLAGVSHQGERDVLPAAVGASLVGSANTLIAAAALPQPPKVLYVSTGYVYAEAGRPLREDDPTAPLGLYAIAKLAGEEALSRLAPPSGVDVLVVRPFNHIGPGQREPFVVPFVARQISDVASGRSDAIRIQSSGQVRDFSDVRDVVRAYRMLITRSVPGVVHNVASGVGISIGTLVETMLELAGISARVETSGSPDEPPLALVGDPSRIQELGWRAKHSLGQTLTDVLADYITT